MVKRWRKLGVRTTESHVTQVCGHDGREILETQTFRSPAALVAGIEYSTVGCRTGSIAITRQATTHLESAGFLTVEVGRALALASACFGRPPMSLTSIEMLLAGTWTLVLNQAASSSTMAYTSPSMSSLPTHPCSSLPIAATSTTNVLTSALTAAEYTLYEVMRKCLRVSSLRSGSLQCSKSSIVGAGYRLYLPTSHLVISGVSP